MPETIKQVRLFLLQSSFIPLHVVARQKSIYRTKRALPEICYYPGLHVAIGIIAQPLFLRLYFSLPVCFTFWEKRDEQIDNSTYTQGI